MNKIDELIASTGAYPRKPHETAMSDQGAEAMRQSLQGLGIDTGNADQMRGVLGGVVMLANVHALHGGQLTSGTLGATIMTAAELQP